MITKPYPCKPIITVKGGALNELYQPSPEEPTDYIQSLIDNFEGHFSRQLKEVADVMFGDEIIERELKLHNSMLSCFAEHKSRAIKLT